MISNKEKETQDLPSHAKVLDDSSKLKPKSLTLTWGHYINQQKKQYIIKGEIHQIYQTYFHQVGIPPKS